MRAFGQMCIGALWALGMMVLGGCVGFTITAFAIFVGWIR